MDVEAAIALVSVAGSAAVSGAATAAGQSAWQSLLALARRASGRMEDADPGAAGPEVHPGAADLDAQPEPSPVPVPAQGAPPAPAGGGQPAEPVDEAAVRALAERIAVRAREDEEFAAQLCQWALRHRSAIESERAPKVQNVVSGEARIDGKVVQAGDVHGDINL